jgi:hypothetical protein
VEKRDFHIFVSFLLVGVNLYTHYDVFLLEPPPPTKDHDPSRIKISIDQYRLLKWKTIKSSEEEW